MLSLDSQDYKRLVKLVEYAKCPERFSGTFESCIAYFTDKYKLKHKTVEKWLRDSIVYPVGVHAEKIDQEVVIDRVDMLLSSKLKKRDAQKKIKLLQRVLYKSCVRVEKVSAQGGDGAIWVVDYTAEVNGYVSITTGFLGTNCPVVSISIGLGNLGKLTKEDVLNILENNGKLWRATLVPIEIEGSWVLVITYKVMAEYFEATVESFEGCVEHLSVQAKSLGLL